MKRISAIALFTSVTLAAATGLVAQQPALKGNIPFNFTVGDKSMPAGEYTISLSDQHQVKIQSADRQSVEYVVSTQSFQEPASGSQLVFEKVGDYYFLHQILSPTIHSMNLNVASGKVEQKARTREARLETEEVTLVATR